MRNWNYRFMWSPWIYSFTYSSTNVDLTWQFVSRLRYRWTMESSSRGTLEWKRRAYDTASMFMSFRCIWSVYKELRPFWNKLQIPLIIDDYWNNKARCFYILISKCHSEMCIRNESQNFITFGYMIVSE